MSRFVDDTLKLFKGKTWPVRPCLHDLAIAIFLNPNSVSGALRVFGQYPSREGPGIVNLDLASSSPDLFSCKSAQIMVRLGDDVVAALGVAPTPSAIRVGKIPYECKSRKAADPAANAHTGDRDD